MSLRSYMVLLALVMISPQLPLPWALLGTILCVVVALLDFVVEHYEKHHKSVPGLSKVILIAMIALSVAHQGHAASLPPDEAIWRPLARECAVKFGEQGGLWPLWAECAVPKYYSGRTLPLRVQNYGPNGLAVVLQLCISEVKASRAGPVTDKNCNNCDDPIRNVFTCVGR